jgi:hydrogenase expression/formation protein HypC
MAVPSRIVSIDGLTATVEAFGQTRQTNLMMLADEAQVGDYVILGAGGNFAAEIVPEDTALASLEYLAEVLADGLA